MLCKVRSEYCGYIVGSRKSLVVLRSNDSGRVHCTDFKIFLLDRKDVDGWTVPFSRADTVKRRFELVNQTIFLDGRRVIVLGRVSATIFFIRVRSFQVATRKYCVGLYCGIYDSEWTGKTTVNQTHRNADSVCSNSLFPGRELVTVWDYYVFNV